MAQKLVNRTDILYDLVNNIAPQYFDMDSIDQNRTSYFGYLSEAAAKAIEDTITLEQRRSVDYCPELSNSGARVRQTAKIRGVSVARPSPSRVFAAISILKDDILEKGEKITSTETRFIIDRRSSITHDNIPFSLPDDIIIRAVKKASGNVIYSVSYSGEHINYEDTTEDYLQVYERVDGETDAEYLMMTVILYQYNYNIQELAVTDKIGFMYEGLAYDYDNLLADFEVYYRKTSTDDYKTLELDHYLTTETSNAIYYNDDESGILYILDNPNLNIPVNTMIRVDIKETMGLEGELTLNDSPTYFSLYRDDGYNYAGVAVNCTILSDGIGATNGDTLEDIKYELIDAKTRRDNITTEHDIIQYINNVDTNIQIIKKRNDIEDRRVYMYTLLRLAGEIVPTSTRNLYLQGIVSPLNYGDFDEYKMEYDRKILRAYNKFLMVKPENYPTDNEYMVKVKRLYNSKTDSWYYPEEDPTQYYFTCPFMILVNKENIANYYLTTINQAIILNKEQLPAESIFPYEMITHSVLITRNSHDSENFDKYTVQSIMTRNTSSDDDLYNYETEALFDDTCIAAYLILRVDTTPVAYLPMPISSYDPETREFTFTGEFSVTDFITEEEKLEVKRGLYYVGTETLRNYDSVINYKNAYFDLYVMYKYEEEDADNYSEDLQIYQLLHKSFTEGYKVSTHYYNSSANPYNLILDYTKFTSSWNEIKPLTQTTVSHTIYEVPFIQYDYGIANMIALYPEFESMLDLYSNLLTLTTDFDISLKFISTYGRSKYIMVEGQKWSTSENAMVTDVVNLADLNPTLKFRVHGIGIDISEIAEYIREYLRDHYITEEKVFISNICTAVEDNFSRVKSITYKGLITKENSYDGSYQEFYYDPPEFISQDIITRYVPEQLNIPTIEIELEED